MSEERVGAEVSRLQTLFAEHFAARDAHSAAEETYNTARLALKAANERLSKARNDLLAAIDEKPENSK